MDRYEAELLLDEVVRKIEEIHKQWPGYKILVNSDSHVFLKYANVLDYTYSVPGMISHIDTADAAVDYEKTILDFFLIANAKYIYLLKGKNMHKSGYPYAASKVYGKPFEMIEW